MTAVYRACILLLPLGFILMLDLQGYELPPVAVPPNGELHEAPENTIRARQEAHGSIGTSSHGDGATPGRAPGTTSVLEFDTGRSTGMLVVPCRSM